MTDQSIALTKVCKKCKINKTLAEFEAYRGYCRQCRSWYNKQYRQSPQGKRIIANKLAEHKQRAHPATKGYCPKCKQTKPSFAFHRSKDRPNGLHAYCKECTNYGHRIFNAKMRAQKRRKMDHLMRQFGVSVEEYAHMFEQQHGLCLICHRPPTIKQSLAVDHNHRTGKVRGLLCVQCNAALGAFRDSIEMLEAAIEYLRKHD